MKSLITATALLIATTFAAAATPTDKIVSLPVKLTPAQQTTVKSIRAEYRAKYLTLKGQLQALRAQEAQALAKATHPK